MPGIFDYTNNNNNNNSGVSEKERRQEDEVGSEAPVSPATDDQQLSAACSVTSASPLTPDSSPLGYNLSLVDNSFKMETSTPLKQNSGDVDADGAYPAPSHSADLTDRGSERSSAASDYGTPSNPCLSEAATVYQQFASLKTSPFLSSSMSSPVKGVAGLGGAMRCPPVREAVDPAKYITISGEPDGIKYACSKCGNIYKWRKSLNKHWKEKHDGEAPDPAAVAAAASRYVRLPTPVVAKRPSPAPFSAASSVTRPAGVRGSLAAILPPLPGQSGSGLGLRHSPVNGRSWNQSESVMLRSPQLKTPTFADYKRSSNASASPFSVLAVDSVSSKERPVDLSGSTSRAQTNDDGLDYGGVVLDLSKKGVAAYVSETSSVQDEPIDFSTKTASLSVGTRTYESGFCQATFADRPLELAHAGGVGATTSLNCAQCRHKFTVPSKLNRHFADAHSDMLHVTAAAGDAGEPSCGGSTQLYRYLTTEHSASREAIRCVVCGTAFYRRSAAARHFDQEHVGLHPNPYQLSIGVTSDGTSGSAAQSRPTGVDQQLPGSGNHLRCGRCPFTTDSFAVLARHHLRHSPRRPNDLMTAEMSRIIWSGAGGGAVDANDVKVAELQLLSGTAVSMDENTAIVIPQAPEETTLAIAASSSTASKPFKQTSSGARSSSGRGKRSDAGGSTASAETLLPFKCDLCEYRARWPSEMTQHAKNHSDEKPYHCPQCTYRSKWKWDVVKHLKRCGGGGSARDVIDTTSLSTSSSSSSSVPTVVTAATSQTARRRRTNVRSLLVDVPPAHTPSSYDFPGSVSENSTQPSAATSASSSMMSSRDQLSNGPPNVMVCSRIQDTGSDRIPAHVAVQTVAETVATTVQTKPADKASPTPPVSLVNQGLHYCLQCSFVGHSPAELRRHLRVHSDEKPYSCRTCCYSSKWKCDLKKHLRAYNHVSAVPLAYGGHGRKPTSDWQVLKDGLDVGADDELNGPTTEGDDATGDGDATATADSGNQPGADSSLKSNVTDSVLTKTQRMPNGSNFAGITVGGRLRCRRCDFEAIDLTSFLHHKSTHASVRKDENINAGDEQGLQIAAAAAAARPSHHRRKSSKQMRVPPESKTEKYGNRTASVDHRGVNMECTKLPSDDQVNVPDAVDDSKFWSSLGLRSKNGVSCLQSAEAAAINELDVTADSQQTEQHTAVMESECKTAPRGCQSPGDAGVHEMVEAAADIVMPSPAASSSDTDVEYVDDDQPVDLCRRRASPSVDSDAVAKLDVGFLTKPAAVQQTSNVAHRITTTEADDASGMSKRKRKLRSCDKCGYITDNLTTLQRHVAKHGSAGR